MKTKEAPRKKGGNRSARSPQKARAARDAATQALHATDPRLFADLLHQAFKLRKSVSKAAKQFGGGIDGHRAVQRVLRWLDTSDDSRDLLMRASRAEVRDLKNGEDALA